MTWQSEWAQHGILVVYTSLFVLAALSDLRSYRIPNWLTSALAASFPAAVLVHPLGVDWLAHLRAGGLVLLLGIALHLVRVLGPGDGKLMAAGAVWAGWDGLGDYLLHVALAGGVLAVGLIAARRLLQGLVLTVPAIRMERWPTVLTVTAPMPYGVAIAAGGLMVAPSLWVFMPVFL